MKNKFQRDGIASEFWGGNSKKDVPRVDKTNNVVNTIHPYRTSHRSWVYDDPTQGTYMESFVMGSSEVIDAFVGEKINNFDCHISAKPLPNPSLVLHKIEKDGMEGWYRAEPIGMEHWLCGCVTHYFTGYPETIYVKIDNMKE